MKKKLFLGLLAAAAVSFTACQKDEVISEMPQNNAIGFGTYVGRDAQTKATEATSTTLETSGFGVFAYYTGSSVYNNSTKPEFMYNEKVWLKNSNWYYENTKYWPGDGDNYKVSFFAYAPHTTITQSTPITAFGTNGTEGKGDPTLNFTVASNVSEQVDLLYATPVTNRWYGDWNEDNSDALINQIINFTFNHALTRIGFKVKTARTDYRVNISKITLTGDFNTVGTLNLNTGAWSGENNETTSDTYVLNFTAATNINSTGGTAITATEGYVMTIPTDFTSSDLSVSVEYTYQYEVSSGVWATAVSDTKTGRVNTNFKQGKAYTLVMTLDPLTPIEFNNISVTNWYTTIPDEEVTI